ncbi:MAG: succinate dehydrogenase assembly factor 2 [Steroidobacteraceae bacterium]
MSEAAAAERRRLAWRCRRGMKELDLLLGGWLERHWMQAAPEEKAAFEHFLDLPDPLIAAYLLGRDVPEEPDLRSLVDRLRAGA